MNDSCWLIMTEKGIRRMAKGRTSSWHDIQRPKLGVGEYAVLISVDVPTSAFKPRALPAATVKVSEESLIAPPVQVMVDDPPPPTHESDIPDDAVVDNHCELCGEFESECTCA